MLLLETSLIARPTLPTLKAPPDGRPQVVLIDDSCGESQLLQQAIAEAGVDAWITPVRGVLELGAVARAGELRAPHLILLDATLSFSSSHSVFLMLRGHPSWSMTPIIIYTQAYRPFEQDSWRALGASACWTKPDEWDGHVLLAREIGRTLMKP